MNNIALRIAYIDNLEYLVIFESGRMQLPICMLPLCDFQSLLKEVMERERKLKKVRKLRHK